MIRSLSEAPKQVAIAEKPKAYSAGVGKYIKPDVRTALKRQLGEEEGDEGTSVAFGRKMRGQAFGDFSKW
jgi:hypothetical protein